LEQAFKWELVSRNVADLVEAPCPERKELQSLSVEYSIKLLAFLNDDRLYPLYALAIGCGLRLSELLGLY